MKSFNVLLVTTSHNQLGDTGEKTGVWLEELATPYFTFKDAGANITIASPQGGIVPLDPKSEQAAWQTPATERFTANPEAMAAIQNAVKLEQISAEEFDALFIPGGHGPMWDLANNTALSRIIEAFDKKEKPIGAVCHGVVGLVGPESANGQALVDGLNVTSFTNAEEQAVGLTEVVPFLLETRLKELGAIYHSAEDWAEYSVSDGHIITGQNPASSGLTAQKIIDRINNKTNMENIEKRKQVARSFFEAYRNQDPAAAAALASDTGEFRYIPLGDNGKGLIKGTEGSTWENIANALIGSFPDLTNEVQSITIDNEGNAIVRVFIGGTQAKEIMGIPSKGKYYNVEHLFILNINDQGLIEGITCYWDNWDWFQQIGFNPAA